MKRNSPYDFIYIVRVWRESDTGTSPWRFAVEETATGERHGFCQLADVAGYIETGLESSSDSKPEAAGPRDNGEQNDAAKEDAVRLKMMI
jgi:hypothetical protein